MGNPDTRLIMIELSKQFAQNMARRASARTAAIVLFAFLLNLLSINATLADLSDLLSGAQTHPNNSQAQVQKIKQKPCHHNHRVFGTHKPVPRAGASLDAETGDDLCCTNDDRSGKVQAALRSMRNAEWQDRTTPSGKIPAPAFTKISNSFSHHIGIVEWHKAQLSGLCGAQAQYVNTVRLQT